MTGNLLFARIARRSLVKGPSTSALLGYGTTFLSRFGLFQPFKVLNPSSKLTTLELSLISLPLAPSQNFSFRLLLPFLFNSASEHLYEKRALQVNTLHYNSQCDPLFWLRSKIEINSVQAAHFSYSRGSGQMEESICGCTAESIEREKSCCTLPLLLHASKCSGSGREQRLQSDSTLLGLSRDPIWQRRTDEIDAKVEISSSSWIRINDLVNRTGHETSLGNNKQNFGPPKLSWTDETAGHGRMS